MSAACSFPAFPHQRKLVFQIELTFSRSEIWLQRFSGTITIWPKSRLSDFWHILSDPSPARLDRMIKAGERSCWPKIKFISNRMKVENVILAGLRRTGADSVRPGATSRALEQQDKEAEHGRDETNDGDLVSSDDGVEPPPYGAHLTRRQSSLLEELTRQASVLWHDGTEADEGATTTDEEEDSVTQKE